MEELTPAFLVGHTRSGKEIKCAGFAEDSDVLAKTWNASYTAEEIFEILAVFESLSWRERQRNLADELYFTHRDWAERVLTEHDLQNLKVLYNIRTVFDLLKLGRSLVLVEFRTH